MKLSTVLSLAGALLLSSALIAADDDKDALKDIKCPVSGKEVSEDHSVEYRGAKVYFCCENCPKAFEKDSSKYAAKANAQLVATEQAEQVKCPFTGGKINPDTEIEVSGAKVAFCCNNCKGKATKAKDDEQIELIFSDKAFEKGFEVKKEKKS